MIRPVRTSPLTLQIKFGAMLFRRAVVWYHRPMTDHEHKMSDFAGFDTDALLSWYDQHARHLPWRAFSPERAPAYHVFLSELMLQQTVVATVIPYFQAFLRRWPDIQALAAADEDEVLKAWAGLGYYARARNMLKAARAVCEEYNGRFPERVDQLIKLPGIGPYTAGAIAAIAFDQPAVVLDGNIERVLIRFAAIDRPKKQVKDRLAQGYSSVLPRMRLSDFPQAVMDLGATVCTPKQARCDLCPLAKGCAG
ncbi:MAG: A/G-specific adenine glycosylase, partial [Candidatus Puniceispirillaceae bacterium]